MPQALSKRSSERYPFVASCVATETRSSVRISARTSDLGPGGCYIDTIAHFPVGTDLVLGVKRDGKTLTIEARVVFSQAGIGIGLSFTTATPDQQALLDQWIVELSGEPIAKPATGSELHEAAAKDTENHTLPVMNELILLLLQKGVLNEAEGKSLLQKLKEKRS